MQSNSASNWLPWHNFKTCWLDHFHLFWDCLLLKHMSINDSCLQHWWVSYVLEQVGRPLKLETSWSIW
jgi:hypothetical protein